MKNNKGPGLSLSARPVLSIEVNGGECPRCKGASKIPNLVPAPYLRDCPDCEGTGRIEMLAPMTEEDLDESVLLGRELAQLRRAKQASEVSARKIKNRFAGISLALAQMGNAPLLDTARRLAAQGETEAAALLSLLGGEK